ncbi:MAG: DUF1501 domain-containing protein [Acidobacteria bacterium]|nr:DUF1501 domain-containing protein [Acidobacteriota bacterium]
MDTHNLGLGGKRLAATRRQFFSRCGVGVGRIALASLLSDELLFSAQTDQTAGASGTRLPHYPPKIKSVIYLFMAGGPSQFELFDYKPKLHQFDGQRLPDSILEGKRFAFMNATRRDPTLYAPRRKFRQYGQSGKSVSECLPHLSQVVDDLAFIGTVAAENPNHAPAEIFANTGSTIFGRPSMGSWVTYGIGSESRDLPGFVVMLSGAGQRPGGAPHNWLSGFLPTSYQGVPFHSGAAPIPDLSSPPGVTAKLQQETIEAVKDLNLKRLMETGDPEIATRIASYEMAYKLQTSGPELANLRTESQATLEAYGAEPGAISFANNCLLARRLVERGVRFVQLYHSRWDSHGGMGENLTEDFDVLCRETDRACAALIQDLKQRGLLDQTLVIWGGEFGRAPMGELSLTSVGRNHHIEAFTMWFAGGGVKPGQTVGETDDIGFSPVADRVDIHDVHATILHLFGLDHTRLTYRSQGRDFRLTDVSGRVVQKLLA